MTQQRMSRAEWWLVFVLRTSASVLLLATVAVFLPFRTMAEINDALTLAPVDDTPLFNYLTRSVSALYVLMGVLILYLSFDVRRHAPVVKFVGWANLLLGMFLLALDLSIGLPWFWVVSEGPPVMALGLVILWLYRLSGLP